MKLRETLLVITFIAGLSSCGSHPPAPSAHLPATGEAPGWSKQGATRILKADELWKYIDGDAERFRKAGVVEVLTADYRYRDRVDAVADIFVMATPAGAMKIWNSEPAAGSQPIAVGDGGRHYGSSLMFHQGSCYVRLVAYQETPSVKEALLELARAMAGPPKTRK